jgi:hypothetical protein
MARWEGRGKQLIVCLISHSVSPIVGQNNDRPRPHRLPPSGTALPLKKGSRTLRRFVLQDGAHLGVVKTYLKR